jgi:hypothetical protein|tara:strand:- start:209 stop:373 length:165 start_codon:yes stop_codon:yes gene_type:complete
MKKIFSRLIVFSFIFSEIIFTLSSSKLRKFPSFPEIISGHGGGCGQSYNFNIEK